ncbi:hypothetical protein [Methanocalculus sp. MC3]
MSTPAPSMKDVYTGAHLPGTAITIEGHIYRIDSAPGQAAIAAGNVSHIFDFDRGGSSLDVYVTRAATRAAETQAEVLAQDIRLAEARIATAGTIIERKTAEAELKILQSAVGKNWQAIDSARKSAAEVETAVRTAEKASIESKLTAIFGSVGGQPAPSVISPPPAPRSQVTMTDPVKAATAGMITGMGNLQATSARAQAAQSRHDYDAWMQTQQSIDQTRSQLYTDVGLDAPAPSTWDWSPPPSAARPFTEADSAALQRQMAAQPSAPGHSSMMSSPPTKAPEPEIGSILWSEKTGQVTLGTPSAMAPGPDRDIQRGWEQDLLNFRTAEYQLDREMQRIASDPLTSFSTPAPSTKHQAQHTGHPAIGVVAPSIDAGLHRALEDVDKTYSLLMRERGGGGLQVIRHQPVPYRSDILTWEGEVRSGVRAHEQITGYLDAVHTARVKGAPLPDIPYGFHDRVTVAGYDESVRTEMFAWLSGEDGVPVEGAKPVKSPSGSEPVRVDQMSMLDRASFELTRAQSTYDKQFTQRLDRLDVGVSDHSVLSSIDIAMKAAAIPIMGPMAIRQDSHVGVSGGLGIIEGPGSLAFMTAGLVIASPRLASSAWDMVTTRPAEIPGAAASGGIAMGEHMLAQAATPRGLTRLGTEMQLGGLVLGKAWGVVAQSKYGAYLGDATLGRVRTAYHAIRHPGEAGVIRAAGATARDAHFIPASTTERSLALVTRTPVDDLVAKQTAHIIGKHQGTVFGSVTAHQNIRILRRTTTAADVRGQVGRLAKDIDLRVTSPEKFIDDLWTNVYSKLPGYKRTPTAIETAAGQHVFDVKDAVGQGIPGAASVTPPSTPPGTGFFTTIVRRSAAPGTHDIIRTGAYGQEAYAFQLSQRKAAGMYEILRGRAHAGRVKDVYDFVEGHRILAGSIRESASQAGTVKGALLTRKAGRLEARGEYLKGHPAIKPHYDAAAIEVAAGQVSDVQRISQVLKLQPGQIPQTIPGGVSGPAPVRIRVSSSPPAPKPITGLIVGSISPAISRSVSPAIHSPSPGLPSFSPVRSPSPRSSPAPSQGLPSFSPVRSPSPKIRVSSSPSPSPDFSISPRLVSTIHGGSPSGSPPSSPPGSPPSPPSLPPYIPTYSPPGSPPSPPSLPPSSPPSPPWAPPSSPPPPPIKQRTDQRGRRDARDLYIDYEDLISPIAQLERAYTDVRDPKIKPVRAVRDFARLIFGDQDLLPSTRSPGKLPAVKVKKRQPDPLWTRNPNQIDLAGMLSGKPKRRRR